MKIGFENKLSYLKSLYADYLRTVFILLAIGIILIAGCTPMPETERRYPPQIAENIPAGERIDNDILLTGTNVSVDGEIMGDLLAVGNTVTINAPVSGSVIAVGQKVVVHGEIGGSLYGLSQVLEMGERALVDNNAYFVGLFLDTLPGSIIQRDLVVLSLRGRLAAEIGRSLNGLILLMTLDGRINVPIDSQIEPEGEAIPTQQSSARQTEPELFKIKRELIGLKGSGIAARITPQLTHPRRAAPMREATQQSDLAEALPEWLFDRLIELAILLPLGLILLWLFPSAVQRPADSLRGGILPTIGFGLLSLVIAVNILAILFFFFALLLMFGIWLGSVFTWTLAFIVWGLGFPALMLAFVLFILAVLYGVKIIFADLVGKVIFEKIAPKAVGYRVLPFLLGIMLYILLRAIPTFGSILEIVIMILGLGGIWVALRNQSREEKQFALEGN